ncbi:hypothetical protein NCCP2495_01340 [Dietzia sp. NCCP-2495]|nr:hypothetical protein NCCP2495_01340 [Dietzia sp. NCCP-2495]
MEINESGEEHRTAQIVDLGVGRGSCAGVGADRGDQAVADQDINRVTLAVRSYVSEK